MKTVIKSLDKLAELRGERSAMTAHLDREIAAMQARRDTLTADVDGEIKQLESDIKEATLAHGETVKGIALMAVYSKGRVSWDTKGLIGFAVAHPEMAEFRRDGKPSISIRVRK